MNTILRYANKNFTLPQTSTRLREALDDPSSTIDDIAMLMSVDPSLSAKVLKLANSALFRFSDEITSVTKAVTVIGGEATYNISMVETANLVFKNVTHPNIDFQAFWEKSVRTGLIAQSMAQQLKIRGSSRFFVMGVLLNLSELVSIVKMESKYNQYLAALETELPLEAQKDLFGFTFAECSGNVLEAWRLPENLFKPMKHLSLQSNKHITMDESIVYLSAIMAEKLIGKSVLTTPGINTHVFDYIGLKDYEYDIILQFAQAETSKIAGLVN